MSVKNIGRNYKPLPTPGTSVNNNGPSLWDHIINEINPFLPEGTRAVIAGGSVRDFALGFAPRDIDVFLVSENPAYPLMYELALERIKEGTRKRSVDSGDIGLSADLSSAASSDSFGSRVSITYQNMRYTVDVIVGRNDLPHKSTKELLDSFDYGLVRAVYDNGTVQVHNDFLAMAEDGVLRINKSVKTGHKKSPAHRYNEFRRRNNYRTLPPTEWVSTESLPVDFTGWGLVYPDGYGAVEFYSETHRRNAGSIEEHPEPSIRNRRQANGWRFGRVTSPGFHGNILRYRFVEAI